MFCESLREAAKKGKFEIERKIERKLKKKEMDGRMD